MKVLQKLVFLTMSTTLVIASLPFVNSSTKLPPESIADPPNQKENNMHKVAIWVSSRKQMSSKLEFDVSVHGFLLWASVGFLMPIGILTIRMSNREERGRRMKTIFYVHVISQVVSAVLGTVGAVMSIRNFNNSFDNPHQRIGVVLYGLIWLQPLIGLFRPEKGSKRRSAWFSIHWFLGTAMSLLGTINIYTGLLAFHGKTSRSVKLWVILFSVEVFVIAFIYLFQDKWLYIEKQSVVMGNELIRPADLDTSTRDKDSMTEPC